MLIVANKTEIKFMQDLRRCVKTFPDRRFFYLGFSKLMMPKQQLFETFLSLLEDVPKSYMAQVYLCDDGDIIITMKEFNKFQFLGFVKKLSDEMGAEGFMEMVDVMDVKTHWQQLEKIFKAKLDVLNDEDERRKAKARQEDAEAKILTMFEKIDPRAIDDINTRRRIREEPCIMVVDDDQLSRTLASNVLQPDYQVSQVQDGRSAILQFIDLAPDLVFLDIGLPDINGHEVLEQIYQIDPEAYVIMFSGRKDKQNMLKALQRGAFGFVGKPFTREKMHYFAQQCPSIQEKSKFKGAKAAQR